MPDLEQVPLLGTALPMVVSKRAPAELLVVGSWVKLRNVGARVVQGQLQVRSWAGSCRVGCCALQSAVYLGGMACPQHQDH